MIFGFRVGQSRFAVRAPINRFFAFVNIALFQSFKESPYGKAFVNIGHRKIRIIPIAGNTQAFKTFPLQIDEILRESAGFLPESRNIFNFLFVNFHFFDKGLLYRQAVAVPAGHVRRIIAHKSMGFIYYIFKNFI